MFNVLNDDDIIEEGDEYWQPRWHIRNNWLPVPSDFIGEPVKWRIVRRHIGAAPCPENSHTG